MEVQSKSILSKVAHDLRISEEILLRHGLRTFLEQQLRKVNAEMFEILGHYGINSVEDMERLSAIRSSRIQERPTQRSY
jgi:hypothetical protein